MATDCPGSNFSAGESSPGSPPVPLNEPLRELPGELRPRPALWPPLWIFTLLGLGGVVWLLNELREIVFLLVIAYCIAYVIEPVQQFLEARGIRRALGFILLCVILFLVVGALALTAAPTLAREYSRLIGNFASYVAVAKTKLAPYVGFLEQIFPLSRIYSPSGEVAPGGSPLSLIPEVSGSAVQKILHGVGGALVQGYSITMTLVNLTLLPFIVYYLSIGFPQFHRWVLDLFPHPLKATVAEIACEIDSYTASFVRGQLMVCTVLFVLYAIGLGIVGVELWFLLAVITGFGNLIPYVGFLVGILLSSIMALVTFGSLGGLFAVLAVFAVVQLLEGTLITPRLIGEQVGFSPLVVILALVAGGQLLGLLGVFLAIPVAAIVKVLASRAHDGLIAQYASSAHS